MQDKSDSYSDFSDRLDRISVKIGLSMAEMARAMDVSRTTLYDIKNRKIPISDKMWRKLSDIERKQGGALREDRGDYGEHLGPSEASIDKDVKLSSIQFRPMDLEEVIRSIPRGDAQFEAGRELMEQMVKMQRMIHTNLEIMERQQELQRKLLDDMDRVNQRLARSGAIQDKPDAAEG